MSDNIILCIFGRKGSGKTTLVREIIEERPRVFVIDTLAEYPERGEKGYTVLEGRRACIDGMLAVKEERRFRLSLRVLETEHNLELMDLAYEFPGCTVVVEETSLYTKAHHLPIEIARLVRYGRHREIDQIYVARRPSEVARDLTAQADLIVTFEQREPRDVKYLREVGGEEAEKARTLPPYKVLAFGDLAKAPVSVLQRIDRPSENQLDLFPDNGDPSA